MQHLLAGTRATICRRDWTQLSAASRASAAPIRPSPLDVQSAITANAVLSPQQLAALSPADQQQIVRPRGISRAAAGRHHEALANTAAALPRFRADRGHLDAPTIRRASWICRRGSAPSRHAAERADQAAGALSGDAGAGVGAQRAARARAGHRRAGQFATRFEPSP